MFFSVLLETLAEEVEDVVTAGVAGTGTDVLTEISEFVLLDIVAGVEDFNVVVAVCCDVPNEFPKEKEVLI
jgi:hypothetical protein